MKHWIVICITLCASPIYGASPYTQDSSTTIQPLKPLDNLPHGTVISPYVQRIRDTYTALQSHLASPQTLTKQGHFRQYDETIQLNVKLQEAIFWPQPASSYLDEESEALAQLMNSIGQNIFTYISQYNDEYREHISHTFWPTYERTEKRYRLATIIQLIRQGKGYFAHAPSTNELLKTISPTFFHTLMCFTGRIFVVDLQEKIISTFSGTVISNPENNKYDRVLTCCHSMNQLSTHHPKIEFYFVKSDAINQSCGLPHIAFIKAVCNADSSVGIDVKELIQYLRSQNNPDDPNVRSINNFHAHKHSPSDLLHHQPLYMQHEDIGFGYLDHNGFNMPHQQTVKVEILNNIPQGEYTYYAVGYAGFPYFQTHDATTLLMKNMRASPFVITSACSQDDAQRMTLKITTGRKFGEIPHFVKHQATTVQGMSGGAVFFIEGSTIKILGVVSRGSFGQNYLCQLS